MEKCWRRSGKTAASGDEIKTDPWPGLSTPANTERTSVALAAHFNLWFSAILAEDIPGHARTCQDPRPTTGAQHTDMAGKWKHGKYLKNYSPAAADQQSQWMNEKFVENPGENMLSKHSHICMHVESQRVRARIWAWLRLRAHRMASGWLKNQWAQNIKALDFHVFQFAKESYPFATHPLDCRVCSDFDSDSDSDSAWDCRLCIGGCLFDL